MGLTIALVAADILEMEQSAQMTMNVLTTQTLVTMMQFVRTQREPTTAPVIMAMKEMGSIALVSLLPTVKCKSL